MGRGRRSPAPVNVMKLILNWKSIGLLLASMKLIHSTIYRYLPREIRTTIQRKFFKLFSFFIQSKTIIIREQENFSHNEIFESAHSYLTSKCLSSARVVVLSKTRNSKNITSSFSGFQEEIEDTYDGMKFNWTLHKIKLENNFENRWLQLSFDKKHVGEFYSSYLPHISSVAEDMKSKNRERRIYRVHPSDTKHAVPLWKYANLKHPASFETLAIDPNLKTEIVEDLTKFVEREEFYKRVGRAWKRGYLLYGPPGTGKTSLVAAIANFLHFDIYDIELTAVESNSKLKDLLLSTSNKSVIVIEDVDCSVELNDRKKKDKNAKQGEDGAKKNKSKCPESDLTLSGVLNFLDGLWSSCGRERVIILTTNRKEKLDQALLRPGRMDKHIHLSYCGFPAFKILAKNYLDVDEHELMKEVENLLPDAKMTPADVAEIFMACDDDADSGMKNVVEEVKRLHEIHADETKKD